MIEKKVIQNKNVFCYLTFCFIINIKWNNTSYAHLLTFSIIHYIFSISFDQRPCFDNGSGGPQKWNEIYLYL